MQDAKAHGRIFFRRMNYVFRLFFFSGSSLDLIKMEIFDIDTRIVIAQKLARITVFFWERMMNSVARHIEIACK